MMLVDTTMMRRLLVKLCKRFQLMMWQIHAGQFFASL